MGISTFNSVQFKCCEWCLMHRPTRRGRTFDLDALSVKAFIIDITLQLQTEIRRARTTGRFTMISATEIRLSTTDTVVSTRWLEKVVVRSKHYQPRQYEVKPAKYLGQKLSYFPNTQKHINPTVLSKVSINFRTIPNVSEHALSRIACIA